MVSGRRRMDQCEIFMQTMTIVITLAQLAFTVAFCAAFWLLDPLAPEAEARPTAPVNDVATFSSNGGIRLLHLPRKI